MLVVEALLEQVDSARWNAYRDQIRAIDDYNNKPVQELKTTNHALMTCTRFPEKGDPETVAISEGPNGFGVAKFKTGIYEVLCVTNSRLKLHKEQQNPRKVRTRLSICDEDEEGHASKRKVSNRPAICDCLLYTSPSPRDGLLSRMPSSA